MLMGAYKQIKNTFMQEYKERSKSYTDRLLQWRSENPVVRVNKPTNIARARELGYKAKEGVIMVRAKVKGGRKKRPLADGGRKPSKAGRFFSRKKSMQAIAEDRASRKFINCEVLNSYFVGKSGSESFFEVIMLERGNPSIMNDSFYSKIVSKKGRSFRGLTRQGREHRGLT
jgi:large subunit ribosomal protein L15e